MINIDLCVFLWYLMAVVPEGTETLVNSILSLT